MTKAQAKILLSPGDYIQFEAMMDEMNAIEKKINKEMKEAMK